jgi:tetratricopeptide (TPR) repeat protein
VLEGSVRKGGGRVRITAQLIDAETGTNLWADRFDGSVEDVFDLQDKIASSVAGIIEPGLQAAESRRSANRPTSDLTAYDAYLRANAMLTTSGAQIPQALTLLEEAIGRDPNYGPALANAAFALGWFGEDIGSMIAVIDRALRLNPSHARGWYLSGTLRLFAGEAAMAIEHLETALRLSPRARLGTSIFISG